MHSVHIQERTRLYHNLHSSSPPFQQTVCVMISTVKVLLCFFTVIIIVMKTRAATITKWIQLNMCSAELRVSNSTASARGYAVFPLGTCILHKGGNYQLWNEVPSLSSTTELAFTRGIYSDVECSTPTAEGEQSLTIPLSCEVVIIPGNLDPYPNILYSAQLLSAVPAIPGEGWTDIYYDKTGCSSNVIGFTYLRLNSCQFDANGYIIDYEKLGIPNCDFKLTNCGTLWYYNSVDNNCVPTDVIKTQMLLPKRFGKCNIDIDNQFVFSISNGINVRTECELPDVPDLVCFSGQELIHMESGEMKMIKDVHIGDKIKVIKIAQWDNGKSTRDGSSSGSDSGNKKEEMVVEMGISTVIAIPHDRNDHRALFHEISTKMGHNIRVTADHVIPSYINSSSASSSFVNTLAQDVLVGSFLIIEDGELDEVISNNAVISYGLYSVIPEDFGSYLIVSGIAASPFAVSHIALSWFYSVLYHSGFLRMSNYKDKWAYRSIEGAASALYSILND